MTDRKATKKLIEDVDRILFEDWSPIGGGKIELPRDEYSSYAPKIAGMVERENSVDEISSELLRIEMDEIGLGKGSENNEKLKAVAIKLKALKR